MAKGNGTWEEREKRAATAYLKWRMTHTLENRTPKEMWLAGYYYAIDEMPAKLPPPIRPSEWPE
jgi:hypothetical protein